MTDLGTLVHCHAKMQGGCYFSGADEGPGLSRFLWSEHIPDTVWNFAIDVDDCKDEEIDWVHVTAGRRNREAAMLATTEQQVTHLTQRSDYSSASPERWMVCDTSQLAINHADYAGIEIDIQDRPRPQEEFLEIFKELFDDPVLNIHFKKHYVPALQQASAVAHVQQTHFVGSAGGQAVTCASIYVFERNAALYNVGTRTEAQKRGYGRRISLAALDHARTAGCNMFFLQCEVGTHVERLYKRIGFSIVATPSIVVLKNA